jgi:hypothetical protein
MGINQSPILIASPPRSGTVLLAGLLHHHGVWIGRSRTTKYPGTNPELGVENIDIKEIMKREGLKQGYKNWGANLPNRLQGLNLKELKKEIEKFVPKNRTWLVKTSWTLTLSEFWMQAYLDALWILPVRTEQAILDSMNRHPGMCKRSDKGKLAFIQALQTRQSEVSVKVKNSLAVDVKKVSQKDKEEIQRVFDFVNIVIDWNIVNKWIEPWRMK